MVNSGLIFDIKRYAIHDGPGIRTTVFLKGCPLKCWWCHNPEGILREPVLMFYKNKCMKCQDQVCAYVCPTGAITFENKNSIPYINRQACNNCEICSRVCPTEALKIVGRKITIEELIKEIEKDILLYDNSGGGVTFSGGEPLLQYQFLIEALKGCKRRGIHTVLDTSGYAPEKVLPLVADYVDMFLYDLKLADDKDHILYTGVSNSLIINNLRILENAGRGKDIILRFPVITGITGIEKNIDGLVDFVSSLKSIREIDLLPFHEVSEKYNRLGIKYKMPTREAPSQKKLQYIKKRFEQIGLYVKI